MNTQTATPPTPWRDRLLTYWARKQWRGFLRLKKLLKPAGGGSSILAPSRYGHRFHLVLWDAVDTHVMREGFYESEVVEALRLRLQGLPASVLWVVGANFGLHAVTLKALLPSTRVLAFEPSPAMAARLLENAELNRARIELHAYALSDENGLRTFHANTSGNPGMSTLHPCAGFTYEQQFSVATSTAEQVIRSGTAPTPHALLIDAEGAEEAILRGLGPHLADPGLRTIVLEAGRDLLTDPDPPLARRLRAAGFSLSVLERRENTAHNLENYLALRN